MPEDEDVPGGPSPPSETTFDPWTRLDSDGLPRVDLYELIYGRLRIGAIPNYAPAGSVTAAAASAEVAAANLLDPEDDAVWQSPGVSDQADKIRLDLPATPAPWVTSVALHGHNLSADATLQLRGYPAAEDPDDHADMVVLPVSEVARGAGVTGNFADVDNGVDAWTDPGLTVPSSNAVTVRCAVPPAAPRTGAGAGLIRLRIRLAAAGPTVAVELAVEIRQSGGTYVSETAAAAAAELAAGAAGGIVMIPFDPADLLDAEAAVDLNVVNVSGPSIVIRELDVVFERVLPAGVYRSSWRQVRPQTVSDLDAVIRDRGGYLRPSSYAWWLTSTAAEAAALGLPAPEVDLAAPRTAWEVRIRDGANADGYLEARSILAGGHFVAGLASATLGRYRPAARQQLLSGGERRVALGPSRRGVTLGLFRPLVTATREIYEGLAANQGAVIVALWPNNLVVDDAFTLVAVPADDSTDHLLHGGDPKRIELGLAYTEV